MKTCILSIRVFLFFAIINSFSNNSWAQPSGGPYGPVVQTYELPKTNGKIYYVSPDGIDKNNGLKLHNPTTLEKALEKAKTGDVIILRGGAYRTGELLFNQGITMQPYGAEKPVLKGTYVATDWTKSNNGIWVTNWKYLFPSEPASWWKKDRNEALTPLHRFNNDMVFINGSMLQSAGSQSEVNENTFYINYETKKIYIGVDPSDKLVEITAFKFGLKRTTGTCHGKESDKKGPVIRGLKLTQFAFCGLDIEGHDPEGISPETEHGKDVVGAILENCEISYCSRVASYLRGDGLVVKNCKISHTSTEGIFVLASNDVLLEKNIFEQNNIENITGYFPAAVKIFNQCHRVTCRDNLIRELPNSNGIWYDVGNVDGIFINNHIQDVGFNNDDLPTDKMWPSQNGFFFEISRGVICAGNVFLNCDHGMLILNSCNAKIYNNTFVNSTACIGRDTRSAQGDHFGWHPSTGPDVTERIGHEFMNNLMVGTGGFHRSLLYIWQPAVLCEKLPGPSLSKLDHNVYVRKTDTTYQPLILWSPAKNDRCQAELWSPESINNLYPGFETNGIYFKNDIRVFEDIEKGNYKLSGGFLGKNAGTALPQEIYKVLYINGNLKYIGAYPEK